jgi:isoleucyl-tRNA synthetase
VPVSERPEIDRWALALLNGTVVRATVRWIATTPSGRASAIESFVDQAVQLVHAPQPAPLLEGRPPARTSRRPISPSTNAWTGAPADGAVHAVPDRGRHQNLVREAREDAPLSVHLSEWPAPRPECATRP